MEKGSFPTVTELQTGGYISETTCPNGQGISIDSTTGKVTEVVTQ